MRGRKAASVNRWGLDAEGLFWVGKGSPLRGGILSLLAFRGLEGIGRRKAGFTTPEDADRLLRTASFGPLRAVTSEKNPACPSKISEGPNV